MSAPARSASSRWPGAGKRYGAFNTPIDCVRIDGLERRVRAAMPGTLVALAALVPIGLLSLAVLLGACGGAGSGGAGKTGDPNASPYSY